MHNFRVRTPYRPIVKSAGHGMTMVGVRDPKAHKTLSRRLATLEDQWDKSDDPGKQDAIDAKMEEIKRHLKKVEVPMRSQGDYGKLLGGSNISESLKGFRHSEDETRYGALPKDEVLDRISSMADSASKDHATSSKKEFGLQKSWFDNMTGGKGKVDLKAKAKHEELVRQQESDSGLAANLRKEMERMHKHPGVQAMVFKAGSAAYGRDIAEIDEDSRRRKAIAVGLTGGLGASGYQAHMAREAFIASPEASSQVRAEARQLLGELKPNVDNALKALQDAKEKARAPFTDDLAKLLMEKDMLYDKAYATSQLSQDAYHAGNHPQAKSLSTEAKALHGILQDKVQQIKNLNKDISSAVGTAIGSPKSGGGGQFDKWKRARGDTAKAVMRARSTDRFRTTTGLSQYLTPQMAAKALGVGALAGGLYYAGDRLIGTDRTDSSNDST